MLLKKLLLFVFSLQIIFIGLWNYSYAHREKTFVDPDSGILVRNTTPEDAVNSYYELLGKKSFETAASIQTDFSKKTFTPKFLKENVVKLGLDKSELVEIFPATVDDDIALVPFVRKMKLLGMQDEAAVFGISILMRDGLTGEWKIANDAREINKDRLESFLKLTIKAEKNFREVKLSPEKYSKKQLEQIKKQVSGMISYHENELAGLKKK